MTTPDNPQDHRSIEARLVRLEELAGFGEHTADQLAEEVRLLNARVHDLAFRVQAMEGRLGGVVERVEKVEERGGGTPSP